MPELPEVETVVRSIAPHLVGRVIVAAELRSKHVTTGGLRKTAAQLAGRRIESLRRHGKYIVAQLDRGLLVIHLGMTGRLLAGAAESPWVHGVFELDQGVVVYEDPRQFGSIEFAPTLPAHVASLGPDALEIGFEEFYAALKKRQSRIKPLLLNQRFVRGIGNIYADESLFQARIHPLAMASRLSKRRVLDLYTAMREILETAIANHGSSVSDYVDASGERGWFQNMHRVYGKEGEPCTVCGGPIKRIVAAQRGTHFCPACQRR